MSETTQDTLVAAERRRLQLTKQLADERERHKAAIAGLQAQIAAAEAQIRLHTLSLDVEKIALAESVIYVRGSYAEAGTDRAGELEGAIADLVAGCPNLRTEYFGTKDYDRWHGQASRHTYGYGPKHGSIIFAIGLTKAVRDCFKVAGYAIKEESVDAAVYYLRNLEKIQQARREAAVVGSAA